VKVQPGSALDGKVGKIPSMFNGNGEAHGLTGWNTRPISAAEVAQWAADPRLNLCVRTGPISGVYAFDVDVDDERAAEIASFLDESFGEPTVERYREGSLKFLVMFRMDEPCGKRKIKLDDQPRGPAIEMLGSGQQFVACGTHASGVRYAWRPDLPRTIPTITLAQLDEMWASLTTLYSAVPAAPERATAAVTDTPPEVLTTISDEDWAQLVERVKFLAGKLKSDDEWSELGYSLLSLQSTRQVSELWASLPNAEWRDAAMDWWAAHRGQQPRADWRHLFSMSNRHGFQRVAPVEAFAPVPEPEPNSDLVDMSLPAGRPAVRVSGAEFSNIVKQLEQILAPHVYTQGGSLVRTTEAHSDDVIQRSADALMLVPATPGWARVRFGDLCDFVRYDAKQKEWVPIAPSAEHVNTLLDQGGWTVLRPIEAIARAPFLRADDTVCDVPGYDPASRTLYIPGAVFPPIPMTPTRSQAEAALARLREPFNEFPWKEPASESAFVSHILAECGRLAMERCPMYFYDAPMAGTGKSTLQEMAARIVHGTEPALRPWVADEDELRKSLYACLMAGDRSIWFDNVPDGHKVRSAVLEAFLTSAMWKDRKLGESVTTGIANKTVLVASGNNLTPVSALARRSIVVRLDANTEHLRERTFRIANPRRYVMERRGAMLVDALTIIRAFLTAAGPPPPSPTPLPSFEDWSRLARDPLIWLGMADPVVTQLNETDDESQNIGPVFTMLHANFGGRTFTAGDMARVVGSLSDENNELSDALMNMGCADPNSPVKVGYWLRAAKDKIGDRYKLVHDGHGKQGVRWRLHDISGGLT
jgi:hypothetical protein